MSTLDIRRASPHVAEVWLNRPELRNAFNDGVIAELTQAFATLAHVFNHGTHHRGQVTAALTALRAPSPELDLVAMLQEEAGTR